MIRAFRGTGRFDEVAALARSAASHRLPAMAGEAAFFAALAAFPMLLTVVAVLNAADSVFGPGVDVAAAEGLTSLLRLVLTTRGSTAADAADALLSEDDHGLLTVGSVVALVLMARALRSVLYGLGVVSGMSRRSWLAAMALALVLLFGGAVVLAVAVLDPLQMTGLPVWRFLRWPVLAAALFGWAVLVIRVGTGRARHRRRLLVGAGIATAGWFAASSVFPLYVAVATRFTSTLGALGGGLILLVWLYLLMVSLYLGAEVSRAAESRPATGEGFSTSWSGPDRRARVL